MAKKQITREEWINRLLTKARPMFKKAGSPLPANIRVSIAPPNANGKRDEIVHGTAWYSDRTADGACEIWLSASIKSPLELVGVLVHELCHVALPPGVGHKAPFAKLGKEMHLTGLPTEMGAGSPEFAEVWEPILAKMPAYPGAGFKIDHKPKADTRREKVVCVDCGYLFRTGYTNASAAHTCPGCGGHHLVNGLGQTLPLDIEEE